MTATNTLFVGGYTPANDFFINGRYFIGFGGTVRSNGAGSSLEANVQRKSLKACTLQYIGCTVTSSSTGANSTNWVSRVGGADGNQLAVLTSSVTGYIQDTTHTDAITASSTLFNAAFHGVSAGPDCFITMHTVTVNFSTPWAEMAWSPQANIDANALALTGTTDHFNHLQGGSGASGDTSETTETDNTKITLRAAGTYQGLWNVVTTNTSGSVQTFHKNGADGNQTISPATASSATFTQDTTHTDSITSGDKANYRINAGNHAMNITLMGCSMAGTNSAQDLIASTGALYANADGYMGIAGSVGSNTTESQMQVKWHVGGTWDRLRYRVSATTLSTSPTFISRNATANGNQTVTLTTGSGAATFEDTTHTDSVSADALVNWKYVNAGGTGSSTNTWVAGRWNDNSNSGTSTETGTVVMSLTGISWSNSLTVKNQGSAVMTLSGVSFAAGGARTETGTAVMGLQGVSYAAVGSRIHVKGTAVMALSGISYQISGVDPGAAGKGLRLFSTFG